MARKIYVFTNPLIVAMIISVTLLFLGNQYVQAQQFVVEITNPARDGVNVGRAVLVTGKAKIPSGNHLWVLAHRTKGFKTVWWPQGEGEIDPTTHTWEVTVNLGGPQDIGYEFEFAVIVVNEQEHYRLQAYWNNAMATGDWRPIPMPPTTSAPVVRTVKKVEH